MATRNAIQLDLVKVYEKMSDHGIVCLADLSKKTGISQSSLHNSFHTSHGRVYLKTATAIAYVLETTIAELQKKPEVKKPEPVNEASKDGGPNIGLLLQLILKELKEINKRTESVEARQSEIEKKITEMWEGLK